jgi:hypothetical protein
VGNASVSLNKVQFLSVATNEYLGRWKALVENIACDVRKLDWTWVLVTDAVSDATAFANSLDLADRVVVRPTLPFGFPLASMIRFPAIVDHCDTNGWICYIDADMTIEDPQRLDVEIRSSVEVTTVRHPGFTRPTGISPSLGLRHNVANLALRARMGGLGTWETRPSSKAYVPRKLRKTYAQAAIFFGPAIQIRELSAQCWSWTEHDLRIGLVAKWHDESYLNCWMSTNSHQVVGPEFCFFEYPWLPESVHPVVRVVDKSKS